MPGNRVRSAFLLGCVLAPLVMLTGCPDKPSPPPNDEEVKELREYNAWEGLAENPFATYNDGFYGSVRGGPGAHTDVRADSSQMLYSPVLMRADDCSLTLDYGAQDATNASQLDLVRRPYFSTFLHYAAQLSGNFGGYATNCGDRPAGTQPRDNVYLGTTSSGGWTAAFIDDDNDLEIYDVTASGSYSERVAPASPYVLVTAGNVYGHGRLDLFALDVGNGGSDHGGLDLFENNGDGTFGAPVRVISSGGTSATTPAEMALADFNGDGQQDLLVVTTGGTVNVYQGDGNGTFASPITIGSVPNAGSLTLADVNGDGLPDVVLGSMALLSNGTGYTSQSSDGLPNTGYLAFGDFNGDGKMDAADLYDGQVTIYTGNGKGQFTSTDKSYLVSAGSTYINAADIDGDGHTDLIVGEGNDGVYGYTTNMGYSVQFLMGRGDGTFAAAPYYAVSSNALTAGVFTTSGHVDVLTGGLANEQGINNPGLTLLTNDGSGNLTARSPITGANPWSIAAADLNGDGKLDAVWLDGALPSPTFRIGVALSNGDGTFQTPVYYPLPNDTAAYETFGMTVTTATVVTGKKPDVFVTFSGGSYRLPNNGSGALGKAVAINGSNPAFADFNGDGKLDMVTIGSGDIEVSLGNGDGTFQSPKAYLSGSDVALLAVGDFTHNGKVDIAAQVNTGTPAVASLSVLPGNGSGGFGSAVSTQLAESQFRNIAAADVDGDGYPDIVLTGSMGAAIEISTSGGAFNDNPLPFPNYSYGLALGPVYGGKLPDIVFGTSLVSNVLGVVPGFATMRNLHGAPGTEPVGTTTALSISPSSVKPGANVTLKATVTPVPGNGVPTGTVKFFYGSLLLGVAPLGSNGTVSVVGPANVQAGAYGLTASYVGDANFFGSSSAAVDVTVSNAAATMTTLSASPNPANIGQQVTLSAAVSSASGTPSGTVQFFYGSTLLGAANLSSGKAAIKASSSGLPAGSYTVTAKYGGASGYAGSQGSDVVKLQQ